MFVMCRMKSKSKQKNAQLLIPSFRDNRNGVAKLHPWSKSSWWGPTSWSKTLCQLYNCDARFRLRRTSTGASYRDPDLAQSNQAIGSRKSAQTLLCHWSGRSQGWLPFLIGDSMDQFPSQMPAASTASSTAIPTPAAPSDKPSPWWSFPLGLLLTLKVRVP